MHRARQTCSGKQVWVMDSKALGHQYAVIFTQSA